MLRQTIQLSGPPTSLQNGVIFANPAQEDVQQRFSQFGTIYQIKITPEYPEQNILRAGNAQSDQACVLFEQKEAAAAAVSAMNGYESKSRGS